MPNEDNKSSWWSDNLKWVLGGLAVIVGAGVFLKLKYDAELKEGDGKIKRKKKKKKPTEVKEVSNKSDKKSIEAIPDEQMFQQLMQSMQQLGQQGPSQNDIALQHYWYRVNPSDHSDKTRIFYASYVHMFYQVVKQLTMMRDPHANMSELEADKLKAMQHVWNLLPDMGAGTSEEHVQCDLIRLQTAQELKDANKLVPTFDRIIAQPMQNIQQIMMAFMISPVVGRWKTTKECGDKLAAGSPDMWELSHKTALEQPLVVADFSQLHKIAVDEVQYGDVPKEDLTWGQFNFNNFQLKLNKVDCSEESEIEKETTKYGSEWIDKVVSDLEIEGSMVKVLSFTSEKPMALAGSYRKNRIHVCGYIDVETDDGSVKQSETLVLNRDENDANKWTGVYTLEKIGSSSGDRTITFDVQTTMERKK